MKLYKACESAMEEHKRLVKYMVRSKHSKDDSVLDDKSVVDIKVSFDGTWQKRGHMSHNRYSHRLKNFKSIFMSPQLLHNFACR